MSPDFELLRAWRDGDDDAGNELVRRHFASIYVFLRSKASENVDDLVQRTFLGCVKARDQIDEQRSFRAYLYGIARRQLIYYFRERKRQNERIDTMKESIQDLAGSPSEAVALREEQRVVLLALGRIPLDLQIALELHYWEDMSVAEIASVLDIPAGTVKSRLHRARELLRERMDETGASPDLRESAIEQLHMLRQSLTRSTPDSP